MHLNFGSGKAAHKHAPKHCREKLVHGPLCMAIAIVECDWPGCGAPLCPEHAHEISRVYHLCLAHRAQPGLDIGEGEGEQLLL